MSPKSLNSNNSKKVEGDHIEGEKFKHNWDNQGYLINKLSKFNVHLISVSEIAPIRQKSNQQSNSKDSEHFNDDSSIPGYYFLGYHL